MFIVLLWDSRQLEIMMIKLEVAYRNYVTWTEQEEATIPILTLKWEALKVLNWPPDVGRTHWSKIWQTEEDEGISIAVWSRSH